MTFTKPRRSDSWRFQLVALAGAAVLLSASAASAGYGAFVYDPIAEEDIVSAAFSVDLAAMTAHRTVEEVEVNFLKLFDPVGEELLDLSDALFGTAALPGGTADIDMGLLETGIVSAAIDSAFFSTLATGDVGLEALLTDTDDAMFAIDFMSVTIQTTSDTIESYYGWPIDNENNGFGIGIPDGGDLPSPLPDSIPIGATGTGFDETISSKAIIVPEPTSLVLLACGLVAVAACRARRRNA